MAINCHPIFISCQSVYATQLIPHTKCLWHVAHRHRKIEKREDMRRYACRDLVCKDHKGSDGVNGKAQKGRHDSSDGCQRTSHFSTRASDLIASPVSLGTLKETRSAPGSVIREWTWLCDMALWLPACQRETGQVQDVERCRIMASVSDTTWAEICPSEQFGRDFTVIQIAFALFCKLRLRSYALMWVRVPAQCV